MINNVSYLHFKTNKTTGKQYVVIDWTGLKVFINAKYGLNTVMTTKEFCKMLQLDDSYEFKDVAIKIEKEDGSVKNKHLTNALQISVLDFYDYFLNSFVSDST